MMRRAVATALLGALSIVGCGARTTLLGELLEPNDSGGNGLDASPDGLDLDGMPESASADSTPPDAEEDAMEEGDSSADDGELQGSDSGAECATSKDCSSQLGPLAPNCLVCPDGGEGCQHYVCVSGECETTYCGNMGGNGECQFASECETLLGPLPPVCQDPCPNGKEGCEHYICLVGVCQTTFCD
jgi:hypothetical protein